MARKVKRTSKVKQRTGQQSTKGKTANPFVKMTGGERTRRLPKITTTEGTWRRLLPLIDYAVRVHVQGHSPSPRPRTADPGWEDLLEIQRAVAREVEALDG